ncbi:Adenylate-forming reductase Nps11 [Acrodontium crateriforme]|uniref:Adenylate-forming reductase Nps11 n=1 Tax=Acrodontium crateriforme TaxID=150365 RepID=A0AAQ3REF0_9PEZI|nr:Adenylate-forming reductase Nps11 [Acrodontium crateriforme]
MAGNTPPSPAPKMKGMRTLMETLLALAKTQPLRIYGSYPLTDDVKDGFRDFTFSELVDAVDRCAWFIRGSLGMSQSYETLLYQGESDFRYTIVLFAAIKCGYKTYYQNPKNPLEENLAMLDDIDCSKALYSVERKELIDQYQLARPRLEAFQIASLHELFQSSRVEHFPWERKPWEEAKHDPIIVLHSSGTTGPPKPIVYQNGALKGLDTAWPDDAGAMRLFDSLDGAFVYGPFPAFHLGGFHFNSVMPIFSRCAMVMAPPASLPAQNGPLALHIIKVKHVRMLCAPPVLLTEISRCEGGIDTLAGLSCILYGGGPLRSALGDELTARGVKLVSIYGSTEANWIPSLSPTREDWEWIQFHPEAKVAWARLDESSEMYELCFKDEGPIINERRATHWTLKVDEWRSKDLFIQHPSKSYLWKYIGRRDDILVLENSAKVNPIPVEDVVHAHPLISGAMMAGEHRWPPCFLIEPREHIADVESFRRNIWPIIEEANELVRKDNRVPFQNVIVIWPGGFERSPKGGIMRHKSARKMADLIAGLYS